MVRGVTSFADNPAVFQSSQSLLSAYQTANQTAIQTGSWASVQYGVGSLFQAFGTVGAFRATDNFVFGESPGNYDPTNEYQSRWVEHAIQVTPEEAFPVIQSAFFMPDGQFGEAQDATPLAARLFGDRFKDTCTPIEGLFDLDIRASAEDGLVMVEKGLPVSSYRPTYWIPRDRERLGIHFERLGLFAFDDRVYLRQLTPGPCLWIGAINAYQAVRSDPLTAVELLEGYRILMEQQGKPIKNEYMVSELAEFMERFGEHPQILDAYHFDQIDAALLSGKKAVLIFESGGTRVLFTRTKEATDVEPLRVFDGGDLNRSTESYRLLTDLHWMNFWSATVDSYSWNDLTSNEEFWDRAMPHTLMIFDPFVMPFIIGR